MYRNGTALLVLDGYCSTVQGLLDWFEVDLGFTELSFIQIDLCVLCDFVLYSRVSLSSCPFLDILHCLPRAVGVPLESALNLVIRMSPCGAHEMRIFMCISICEMRIFVFSKCEMRIFMCISTCEMRIFVFSMCEMRIFMCISTCEMRIFVFFYV